MLRWCGRELTKLNPSSCCQGMEAYSSETLGVSMPDICLNPCPPFRSRRWPPSSLGWDNARPPGTPASTMLEVGAFRLRYLAREEVLWLCEEGRKVSEQLGFGKIRGVVLPPFPEVAVDSSSSPGRWEEGQIR